MRLQLLSPHQSSTIPQITTPTQALPQTTRKDYQRASIRSTPSLDIPHTLIHLIQSQNTQHNQTLDTRHNLIPDTLPTLTHLTSLNLTQDTRCLPTPGTPVTLTGSTCQTVGIHSIRPRKNQSTQMVAIQSPLNKDHVPPSLRLQSTITHQVQGFT